MGLVYRLLCAAVVLLALQGCGPIQYVSTVTRGASSSVEAAKAVNADKYAPYYYTLAVEYFHRAKHEAAHSDYQAANRFGRKATAAADKARAIAIQRARDGVVPEATESDGKTKPGTSPLVPGDGDGD